MYGQGKVINQLFQALSDEVKRIDNKKVRENLASQYTYSFASSTLADSPLDADGQKTFSVRFITDARKPGEGAGLGTGLPAFYDPNTDSWFDFSGNAITV